MDEVLVSLGGAVGIAFVYWFFLMRSEEAVRVTDSVNITVDGGYKPELITVKRGQKVVLHFLRKDPSNCLDEIIFPDFKTRRELPLGESVAITITPKKVGTFTYSCGMNMYHGKISVED